MITDTADCSAYRYRFLPSKQVFVCISCQLVICFFQLAEIFECTLPLVAFIQGVRCNKIENRVKTFERNFTKRTHKYVFRVSVLALNISNRTVCIQPDALRNIGKEMIEICTGSLLCSDCGILFKMYITDRERMDVVAHCFGNNGIFTVDVNVPDTLHFSVFDDDNTAKLLDEVSAS